MSLALALAMHAASTVVEESAVAIDHFENICLASTSVTEVQGRLVSADWQALVDVPGETLEVLSYKQPNQPFVIVIFRARDQQDFMEMCAIDGIGIDAQAMILEFMRRNGRPTLMQPRIVWDLNPELGRRVLISESFVQTQPKGHVGGALVVENRREPIVKEESK